MRMKSLFGLFSLITLCCASAPLAKVVKVVATYKNRHVTEEQLLKHYDVLSQDEPAFASRTFSSLSPELRSAVLREYIKALILEEKATEKKIDKSPEYKARLDKYARLLLRESLIESSIKDKVTDESVRNEFQSLLKKIKENGEVKFQYMVFATKPLADKALAELHSGKSFAEIAKRLPAEQRALDESRYFSCGDLSPEIEGTVFGTDSGKVSSPVDTGSGWCLVKILDKRPVKQLPSFERLAPQIKQRLYLENRLRLVDALMQESNVKIMLD
jgi:peptidyl-prolyl cis-trans isomerase C